MDAFFAAVEQRDNPYYRGKAIAVGGLPGSRGVVSTCSYEARRYGVHSAMSSNLAVKLCPHLIFVPGNYEAYREASEIINGIFQDYTDLVEPVSIDEAYLDVTCNKIGNPSATHIAAEIRQKIKAETNLTASAGVSYCKFLAKIASDLEKPDGLVVVPPHKALDLLSKLPIGKFHGIGRVTENKMLKLGITNGADLRKWELPGLIRHFGKAGQYYYEIVRGIDERPVTPSRVRKSLSMERTFSEDINDQANLEEYLDTLAAKLSRKMQEKGFKALTITVKIKYENFEILQRSCTARRSFDEAALISRQAKNLLGQFFDRTRSVRLIGIGLSSLVWKKEKMQHQITLPFYEDEKYYRISSSDRIF